LNNSAPAAPASSFGCQGSNWQTCPAGHVGNARHTLKPDGALYDLSQATAESAALAASVLAAWDALSQNHLRSPSTRLLDGRIEPKESALSIVHNDVERTLRTDPHVADAS